MFCPECGQEKDAARFVWKKNGKQARKPCRDCLNAKQLAKYHSDPEWKAQHRSRCKDWESRNPSVRREISRRAYKKNPEKAKEATRRWIANNREYWRDFMRQWNANNRLRAQELRRKRYAESEEVRAAVGSRNKIRYISLTSEQRAAEVARSNQWHRENRWYGSQRSARRRSAERLATPKWGQEGIVDLYRLASKQGFHVDHIVPLVSDVVCGLHVIFNLQLLPPTDNLSKGNRFQIEGVNA